MEKIIESLQNEVSTIDIQKGLSYAKQFGHIIGIKKEKGNITVTPQYVIISHFLYPSYIGRTALIVSTACVLWSSDTQNNSGNFQKKSLFKNLFN